MANEYWIWRIHDCFQNYFLWQSALSQPQSRMNYNVWEPEYWYNNAAFMLGNMAKKPVELFSWFAVAVPNHSLNFIPRQQIGFIRCQQRRRRYPLLIQDAVGQPSSSSYVRGDSVSTSSNSLFLVHQVVLQQHVCLNVPHHYWIPVFFFLHFGIHNNHRIPKLPGILGLQCLPLVERALHQALPLNQGAVGPCLVFKSHWQADEGWKTAWDWRKASG